MDEEFEALRRLHNLATFIRPLDDETWDHVSFTRNLKVCRNDYAKGICGMNRNPHLYPISDNLYQAGSNSEAVLKLSQNLV